MQHVSTFFHISVAEGSISGQFQQLIRHHYFLAGREILTVTFLGV